MILIGKNSALVGFASLASLILSCITAVMGAITGFKASFFLGMLAILTLLIWIVAIIYVYRNYDKLNKYFSK